MILTKRQAEVVVFINRFRAVEQANPTLAEIAAHFGWKSTNASHDHLQALQRKGVIVKRQTGRYIVQQPHDRAGASA